MELDILSIVGMALVLFLAGIIQSAVGFAFALFATPLLIWMGFPLTNTIAIVSTGSLIQSIFGASSLRADVPWRLSAVAIVTRLATTIIGIFLLVYLSMLSNRDIRFVVGIILCLLVVIQFSSKIKSTNTLHWKWSALAFSSSGLLSGICGMGGPPLVLWTLAHNWSVEKTRGFLFSVFAASIPIQIFLLYITFGSEILWGAMIGIMLAPIVILGAAIGLPLGNKLPKPILRKIVYIILLAIGINSIIPSLMHNLK